MTLFEFLYFFFYLSFLAAMIVSIQVFNPGRKTRETWDHYNKPQQEDTNDVSDEEYEGEPEEETFEMTKNPMFSHQEEIESKED